MGKIIVLVLFIGLYFTSCTNNNPLPIHGPKEFIEGIDKDTIYHTIPYWNFENQAGERISSEFVNDKIYIADFFFSHCPSICPEMLVSLKKVQAELSDIDLEIISFTVDPKNDNVERLKWYAEKNEINTANWNFLTGVQQDIYELGVNGFLVPNQEDALAPGGFLHSEKFILIDKHSRIRGWYDGTVDAEMKQLVTDARKLNNEK